MKFYKHLLFLLIKILLIFIFTACSSHKKNLKWNNIPTVKKNIDKIESGDIIIKKKRAELYSIFGHSAFFVTKKYIAEVPKIGVGFIYSTLDDWETLNSEVIILRYKHMNSKLKYEITKNILNSYGKKYRIFFNKKNNKSYYCSQFIWEIFYRSGKKYNLDIDLDYNGGFFVTPYDLLYHEDLEIIELEN